MARTDNLTNFLTDVADSIREKKGTSEPILASNFDTEIDSITTGGSEYEYAEFDPYNIVEVLDNDTEPYENKFILLLLDTGTNVYTVQNNNTMYFYNADKIKGSDGQEMILTSSAQTYTFDTSKDLINSLGQRVRYFIVYYKQRQLGLYGNKENFTNYVLMSYFKNIELVNSGNTFAGANIITRVIKLDENSSLKMRSANLLAGNTMEEFIMPNEVSFEGTPSFSYALYNTTNLRKARVNLANVVTNIQYCVANDTALKEVEFINCPNEVINTSNLFQNDYSLEKIVATPILKPSSDSYMFGSLRNLKHLSGIDFEAFTSSISFGLKNLAIIENVKNINVNFSVSSATQLTHDSIINIMNALVDLTGQTAKTLTLGTDNINKITDEEKAIAINKNWNLVK